MDIQELMRGLLAGPTQDDRSSAMNMGILHTGLGLLGRRNIGDAGLLGVTAGQNYLDKLNNEKKTNLQNAGMLMQLKKMQDDNAFSERKNAFFSPAGQAPFMTPGLGGIAQPPDEAGGGPGRAPVAPSLDFNKMLSAAAAQNFVPPETYANHLAQREQARATLAAAQQSRADLLQQRQNHKEMAMLVASLRQKRQEPAPLQVTDAAGNVKLYDRQGNLIRDLGGAGKPTAAFEKAGAAKKKLETDLTTAISELKRATADGGLIDKSTGSGIGSLADTGAAFFGQATPGAIAVGQMKPIYDLVLKMIPRFEGPQSDKDTKSYENASGQLANPSVPNSQKKAAAKEILRLMESRKGQFIDKGIAGTEADVLAGVRRFNPATGRIE